MAYSLEACVLEDIVEGAALSWKHLLRACYLCTGKSGSTATSKQASDGLAMAEQAGDVNQDGEEVQSLPKPEVAVVPDTFDFEGTASGLTPVQGCTDFRIKACSRCCPLCPTIMPAQPWGLS